MPKRQSESNMDDPREFAAWAFAAGVPNPKGKHLGFQSLIPPPCYAVLSEMLWNFGFRHHPELQTQWVPEYSGADRNFMPLGVSDSDPDDVIAKATEMLVDQFPDVAARVASMTPENRDELVREQARDLLASVEKLRAATAQVQEEDSR